MLFLFLHQSLRKALSGFMKKFLIVGLGNIGPEYEETRHNIGFKVVEALAKKHEAPFGSERLGDLARIKIKGRSLLLLKPSTYMNLSGKAVVYWMEKENIPLEQLLVVTDDIHLPFGSIRLKAKGSDGGHNGLKDIQAKLGSSQYNRYRFGVGANFGAGRQVDYVLGKWSEEEYAALGERLDKSVALIESFALAGLARTMNQFNNS